MTAIVYMPTRISAPRRPSAYELQLRARERRSRVLSRVLPRLMRAIVDYASHARERRRQRAEARAMYDALRGLDDRMLHDIGLDRSEIMSVACEATGQAQRTRAQHMTNVHGFV
ncbi:MAG TPA: DUF1127 domain-containing protein [Casimicrobiaceae bacterium]|jgi:uncharacterized protein YjiS (DUF1127 family)|nr:DUF1127 domain-containing protein [Casimicrobiaceae bacterium]